MPTDRSGNDDRPDLSELDGAQISQVRAAIASLRTEPIERETPPASLWDSIEAGTRSEHDQAAHVSANESDSGTGSGGGAIDLDRARTARRGAEPSGTARWLVAAAAALVIATSGLAMSRSLTESPDVIANVALDPLDGRSATGEIQVIETDDGLELDLSFDGVDAGSGYLELWVIDENVDAMVSLGPVRDGGRYIVPAAVELATFPIVDLSIEQPDGDPTHGGASVLRGIIET